MSGDVALRWLRAMVLTFVLFASALAGHAAAGGEQPPTALLVPLILIVVVSVAPFVGVPLGPVRVTVLLVAGQAALHLAFGLLAVPAAAGPHQHAGTLSTGLLGPLAGDGHLWMFLGHLTATVVVGLWLAAGERAAWTLVSVAARPWADAWRALRDAACLAPRVLVVARPSAVPSRDTRFAVRRADCVGDLSRRGPPAYCV